MDQAALENVWGAFRAHGADGLDGAAQDAAALFYAGLLGLSAKHEAAGSWLKTAVDDGAPGKLPRLVAEHATLERESVYDADPDAFRAFADGGSNRALYRAVAQAVLEASAGAGTVLDLGSGDGRVVADVLRDRARPVQRMDLVEPSALADAGEERFAGVDSVHVHRETAQGFFARRPTTERWDAVQSTFCFHGIPPSERASLLAQIRVRTGLFLMVEFDVPQLAMELTPDTFMHYYKRYELGLSEYPEDVGNVARGFLVPMFLKSLLAEKSVWEQGQGAWRRDFDQAGFECRVVSLYDYWWAPAVLLVGE